MLKDDDNLPEWVQSKITKAEDYMSTVANYLESEMNEEVGASKKQETTFHKKLDTLVHKTFGKRKEEMKEAKETGFEKTFRKNTGETYDQYANRRAKEEDERQEKMKKQKEDYIKQGIIKAESYELSEGRPSQRHPLEGHEYHRKSDAELVGIAKDAHKAAEAMKSHNTTAENKYRDQANDSATVRYFRKKSGMPDWYKKKYGHMKEDVEIDEAIRHEIAGAVGQFIGNKIDPVHGDIMRMHGKEAYRQAAYHIRKTVNDVKDAVSSLHDRLHKQLRTGGLTTEEVEELEEGNKLTLDNILSKGEQINDRIQKHMDAADFHRDQARKVDAKDSKDIEGYNRHASLTDLHAKAFWSLRHHKKSPNGNHLKDYIATHKRIQDRYKKDPKLTKEEVELDEMDKSQPASSRGAEGLPLEKKADPAKTDKVKQDALKALQKQYKKVKEEVELDEARYPGFRPGLGLGKRGAPSQRDNYKDFNDGRPLGFTPIKDKKPEEPKKMKEEVELDEVSADVAKRVAQARDRSAVANKLTSTQSRRLKMGDKGGDPDMNAAKALKSAMKRGAKNVYGEEVELLDEKNEPTNPELWSRAKTLAKSKFDVYPSAYANGWASKWYKSKGGGWRSVSEEVDLDEGYFKNQEIERQETERLAKRNEPPFTPDKPKKKSVVVGKKPEGYSRARQLARQAMQKYTTPVKEAKEMSRKAKIVKDAMKKNDSEDKFQARPELGDSVTRNL